MAERTPAGMELSRAARLALAPPLASTLASLADALAGLQDPWWIFGSSAAALAGAAGLEPPDVDLLTSPADARTLLSRAGAGPTGDGGSGLFRSAVFGKIGGLPLPVEVMAGLELRTAEGWRPVRFETRQRVPWGAHDLYIPAPAEQIAVLQTFGRPKDLQRARLLQTQFESR